MILTASSSFKRTTSPSKTRTTSLKHAAARRSIRARIVVITNTGGPHRGRRRWARVGWVWAFLDGVRRLDRNTALADTRSNVALELDVASLSPGFAPGVTDEPVVFAVLGSVAYSCDAVV